MELPKRKLNRLKKYDYDTSGTYFITICAHNRKNIFGNMIGGDAFNPPEIILSSIGTITTDEILNIEKHYNNIKIDKFVVMPNHVHLIVRITERINPFPTIKYDIPNVIGKFKAAVTRRVGKAVMPSVNTNIFQRSFHDHIIRGEKDYKEIWEYIDQNPIKWKEDCFYTG